MRLQSISNPCALLMEMCIGTGTMKIVQNFLKKFEVELPHDSAISLSGISPKETKSQS